MRGDCTDSSNSRVVTTISFVVIPVCGSDGSFGRRPWSPVSRTEYVVSEMSSSLLRSTADERSTRCRLTQALSAQLPCKHGSRLSLDQDTIRNSRSISMNLKFSRFHDWLYRFILSPKLNKSVMLHSFQRPGQITWLTASSIRKLC